MKQFQISVKYGLITAVVLILFAAMLYLTNANIFSPFVSILSLLFNFGFLIVMAVLAVKKTRNEVFDGKITFGKAMLASFLVMLISNYIGTIYNYLFSTVIDPAYLQAQLSNFIDSMEGKIPEEALDTMIESMEENINPQRTLLRSVWVTPLFALVVSAIIAAATKKDTTNDSTAEKA